MLQTQVLPVLSEDCELHNRRDLVHGKVKDLQDLEGWRERMREYLPCLDKDANEDSGQVATTIPLTPTDLAVSEQFRQKVFLQRDLSR
jgi:hypothetical protein